MALTELERTLIESVRKSQQQQTQTIADLQKQVEQLNGQVEILIKAYVNLARIYSGQTGNES